MSAAIPCDPANGERSALREHGSSVLLVYTMGLLLAALLAATSFWIANAAVLPAGWVSILAILATAQLCVQAMFFVHLTGMPESASDVRPLALGSCFLILAVAGVVWITAGLSADLPPVQHVH